MVESLPRVCWARLHGASTQQNGPKVCHRWWPEYTSEGVSWYYCQHVVHIEHVVYIVNTTNVIVVRFQCESKGAKRLQRYASYD